jgi:hypothetical protein
MTGLGAGLSGCHLIVIAAMFVGVPDPVSTIDVLWAEDPDICASLRIGGDRSERFIDGPGRYYSTGSTMDPRDNAERDWRNQGSDASFLVLAGTEEPLRRSTVTSRPGGRPEDAARAYFDVNRDGQEDLVYEIYGPPGYLRAFVILPAEEPARTWFEHQLGSLSRDWRRGVEANGGYVFEVPQQTSVRSSAPTGPRQTGRQIGLLHSSGATYLLYQDRDVPFDPSRRSPPLTLDDPKDDAKATTSAAITFVYRVNQDFSQQRVCTFLSQWKGVLVGGF